METPRYQHKFAISAQLRLCWYRDQSTLGGVLLREHLIKKWIVPSIAAAVAL